MGVKFCTKFANEIVEMKQKQKSKLPDILTARRVLMTLAMSLLCMIGFAQKTVRGTVVDTNGEPIISASVLAGKGIKWPSLLAFISRTLVINNLLIIKK